jgi:hypothetical protein
MAETNGAGGLIGKRPEQVAPHQNLILRDGWLEV